MENHQWEVRGNHQHNNPFEPYEVYSQDPTYFSIKFYHGGQFVNVPHKTYLNGKINYIDMVDANEFSVYTLNLMYRSLGYPDDEIVHYHYKSPGLDLEDGLKPLSDDDDIRNFCQYVEYIKLIEVYAQKESNCVSEQEVLDDSGGPNEELVDVAADEHVDVGVDESETDDHVNESDSEDSEFLVDDDNIVEDVEVDMAEYRSIVHEEHFNEEDDSELEEELDCDEDGFDSVSDGDNEPPLKTALKKLKRKKNKESNIGAPCPFEVGKSIPDKDKIKNLVKTYALKTRRQLFFLKDDNLRVRVVCHGKNPEFVYGQSGAQKKESTKVGETSSKKRKRKHPPPTCPWKLLCSRQYESDPYVVRTLIDEHRCLQTRKVKLFTVSFIAKEIQPIIESNPKIPLRALQDLIQKKHQVHISLNTTSKAKMRATKKLEGDFQEQYGLLRDYCEEVKRTNPGTTVKIEVEKEFNPTSLERQFKRIYICLGPLKAGFKCSGRQILGLDGCFMKGPYPGQILSAVGVDANNGIYPVAYSLVEAETTNSWTWFLQCLGDDLDLHQNSNFTFISDRQKGLLPALASVFPSADHRFCLRHIHENMRSKWRGQHYKDLLWKCATASTIPQFNRKMELVREEDSSMHEWLTQIPAKAWARSHFNGRPKCDALLNNWCEVFNRQLVNARDKPVITCLEYIRQYLMKRIVVVHKTIAKSDGPLTPAVTKQFNAIKDQANQYTVTICGGDKYEVSGPWSDQCVVDVQNKTCSCRKWELTGIPCKHAVAVNWNMTVNGKEVGIPEAWVDEVYWLDTWKQVYKHTIDPINGPELWTPSNCPTKLTPPKHHKQVGRPKKNRMRSQQEILSNIEKDGKLTRKGHFKRCGKCKTPGHNARTCKGQGGSTSAAQNAPQESQNASQCAPQASQNSV